MMWVYPPKLISLGWLARSGEAGVVIYYTEMVSNANCLRLRETGFLSL